MAQSTEYPDLAFVRPNAYGVGRDGKSVMYVVVHYTAGSEGLRSAEDGAAYDARRTDGVSTHYFHDQDSTIQCVLTKDRANAALHKGNRLGIQHELCGTVQTRAQWLDAASDGTLWRAAKQIARDCVKYGLPVRRLSVVETRAAWYSWPNGPRGIVGHVDVTNAYPEDGGTHTDPGTGFPWDVLLARVSHYIDGGDVTLTPAEYSEIVQGNLTDNNVLHWRLRGIQDATDPLNDNTALGAPTTPGLKQLAERLDRIETMLIELAAGGVTHEALVAAFTDPVVAAAIRQAAFEGAQRAEDE